MRNPQKFPLPKRALVFWGPLSSIFPKLGTPQKWEPSVHLSENAESAKAGTQRPPYKNCGIRKICTPSPSSRFP